MPGPQKTDRGHDAQAERQGTKYTDLEPGGVSGNLTRDPELRFTGDGRPLASMRVAETERVRNDDTGKWEDGPTSFYDVVVWGQQAEHVVESLQKGARVVVVGRWQRQEWTDGQGERRAKTIMVGRDIGPSCLFGQAKPAPRGQKGRQ